ncbi:histidine kinase [Nitrosomonas sp. Nm33]|uniref:hybrid sensor histidine kinase/response regulator n=1 Tax=Nitrosomonas sp. Nm33 TaxID=133724 RepID=UPI000897043B|nr:histidine kinase [Nitrosomonas sp. Nm33]SDY76940.1 Histidine kinase-, DNA gyrase B-, and HSP90-like ATPase [Nitrosomonas sp. Nm33]
MTRTLNILLVGYLAEDAEHICRMLRVGGLCFNSECVNTIDAFPRVLAGCSWDVVLCDDTMSELGAERVLSHLATHHLAISVIVVSSHGSDDSTAYFVEAGAQDFILMNCCMARLVPAIQRSLKQMETLQHIRETQLALQKSEAHFRAIASNLPGLVFQFLLNQDGSKSFSYVSEGSVMLLGISPTALIEQPDLFTDLILPEDKVSYNELMQASAKHFSTWNWEGRIQVKGDPDIKWVSLRATPRRSHNDGVLWDGIVMNISRNKLAEIEIARSHARLAELTSYLQKVKEHERARIAREIHDDIGGTLTAIKCELLLCMDAKPRKPDFYQQKAASIEELVDYVIDSTRRIAMDLRPGILDFGIVAAIQWQAREFSKRTEISCQFYCDSEDIPLDADLAIAIFRIFQEILTNISKHAGALNVRVKLFEREGWIFLEATDNGRGIRESDINKPGSFGIRGIRERCQQLGGDLYVNGIPEKETCVIIQIPVNSKEQ